MTKQFVLIAYDAKDDGAYDRRMACRAEHLDAIAKARTSGNLLCGMAITDDAGKMVGSVIVGNFDSRTEFDKWLEKDPYFTNKVWENITVLNTALAPTFADLIRK